MKTAELGEYTECYADCPYCNHEVTFDHCCKGEKDREIETCEQCGKTFKMVQE